MNHLANQSSPYLAQHKDNPVDWWPWCTEAFDLARSLDKPIFLSVGYASCHWCHVMAHESFEDDATASYLNDHFVSIKVDREERPDVDALYMEAVQALTGSGGWPMSVFLTPTARPFYGGTYFPPRQIGGRTSFTAVLSALHDAWINRRNEVEQQADKVTSAISMRTKVENSGFNIDIERESDFLEASATLLLKNSDSRWGGFGSQPKFPQTIFIEILLNFYLKSGSSQILEAVKTTLDAMCSGGIYDHLGGGFSRYSVDEKWLVPHFEKMLYDQAKLAAIYSIGWSITKNPNWKQVASETIDYVLRDLHLPGQGLFSSQDADSEGKEGKYYLFSASELEEILGGKTEAFMKYYGATDKGNLEGSNILFRPDRGDLIRSPELEQARQRVFEARRQRVPPGLDDKVILEWNAMFISTLAQIGFMLDRTDWIAKSESLMHFLEDNMRSGERWMRIWHRSKLSQPAFASDYANLVDAYTRIYEATGKSKYLADAELAAHQLLKLFEDKENGGFFTTGVDQEQLIVRTKDLFDGVLPSTNSVAAKSLARLNKLTDITEFRNAATRVVELLAEGIASHPSAFPGLIETMSLLNSDSQEIVIPGDQPQLVGELKGRWLPDAVTAFGEGYTSPLWTGRQSGFAYICRGFSCLAPISTPNEFSDALDSLL
ncbi:MAG: thioredoxin domain-containing protein [Acidimicrobiaceae bacterium]|nr:thioredoxin domain-containing protein [Acidimicrobiaceae bacterium]